MTLGTPYTITQIVGILDDRSQDYRHYLSDLWVDWLQRRTLIERAKMCAGPWANGSRLPSSVRLTIAWKAWRSAEAKMRREPIKDYGLRVRALLREYMDAWLDMGKRTTGLMQQRREISKSVERFLRQQRPIFTPSDSGASLIQYARKLRYSPGTEAARLLLMILTSRSCRAVQRCERCNRIYFAKTSRANKRFCSRNCGNAAWNMRPCIASGEKQKIENVSRALALWPPKPIPRYSNWKRWVHARTGVSINWLTRRAKSGVIRVPSGNDRSARRTQKKPTKEKRA
jgi:hypothetical protein